MAADPKLLEEAIKDFWKLVDERFPKSFSETFLSKVKSASWKFEDDPHYEVPKNIMYMLLEDAKTEMKKKIADWKVWSPVEEAINDMWKNFGTQENKDLKLYCNLLKDERFPKEFISGFIALLDKQKWDSNLDVEYKMAVALMTSHFKKYKEKIRKNHWQKEQKKRVTQAKRAAPANEKEKRIAEIKRIEEEKRTAEECIIPVVTAEQIKENIALVKKNFDNYQKDYLKKQADKRPAFNQFIARKKEALTNNRLRNEFKNCRIFRTFEDEGRVAEQFDEEEEDDDQ